MKNWEFDPKDTKIVFFGVKCPFFPSEMPISLFRDYDLSNNESMQKQKTG